MSKLDKNLIKKYFKDQKPPNLKELQIQGLKYTDPYFPPNINCLIGKDPSGNWIDPRKSDQVIKSLEQTFPGCTTGNGSLFFQRISEREGNWQVFEDKIEMDDVLQGGLGDCYFLTSIAVLSNYPYLIYEKFRTMKYNELGYYEVILFIDGEWQIVFVDDYFVINRDYNNFAFGKPNNYELWAIILEKAWAKVNGGYGLIESGWILEGFRALTGFPTDIICHDNSINEGELFAKILEGSKEKTLMGCSSYGTSDSDIVNGIVQSHAYALAEAKTNGEIDLIKVRNPWGAREWEGPWSDDSPLWTPELRKFFGCKSKNDGIFWIDISNFFTHFSNTSISYILYDSIIKSITIDQINLLKTPLVFNINLQKAGKFSVNTLFPNYRFNRDLQPIQYPIYLVLAKYNDKREIENIYAKGSPKEEIALVQDLSMGNYILWVYLDYEHLKPKKRVKYTLRMACSNQYNVEFMGQDEECKILEYIILDYNKRYNASYIQSSDYYFGHDETLQNEGIVNSIIANKSNDMSLFTTVVVDSQNLSYLKMCEKINLEIPPKGAITRIGIINGNEASWSISYDNCYLKKSNLSANPDYTQIYSFMSLNVKEENTEKRGLSIDAYKFIGKEDLQELPSFKGMKEIEEEERKKREEEEKQKKLEEEKKKAEKERRIKEQERLKELMEKAKRQKEKEEAERQIKINEELERIRQIEEQKKIEEEEKERKRLEEIKNQKFIKVTYSYLQNEYPNEINDLDEYCPECAPFNEVKRDWVIIKYNSGDYIGEVKTGTEVLHGRGFILWNNSEYIYYSYFSNGVGEHKATIKKKGSHDWIFDGLIKNGKKNGKGTFVAKTDLNTGKRLEYYVGNFVDDFMEGKGTWYFGENDYWYGIFIQNKKNGVGLSYIHEKNQYHLQKYDNDVFVREIPITNNELQEMKKKYSFINAMTDFFNEVVEKEKFAESLDVLPQESEESKLRREYYEKLDRFKEEEPFLMKIYLRLHQKTKTEEEMSYQYNIIKHDCGNNKLYIGQYNEDGLNGKGVLRDGNTIYAGFWVNGLPNAFFYIYKDGYLDYKGIFNNWNKVGQGTLYENGHPVYKGDLMFDRQSGYGIKFLKTKGEFFQGEFSDGEMKYEGKYYSREGLVYQEVSIENGKISQADLLNKPYIKVIDGYAESIFEPYSGVYPDFISKLKLIIPKQYMKQYNLRWGATKTKDGDIYIGQLNGDEPYGMGGIIYCGNRPFKYYIGYVKHGLYHDQGTIYTKNFDIIYEGGFEYGKKEGYGIEYLESETYKGYFSDDKRNGAGVIITSSSIFEGHFIDGKKQGKGYVVDKEKQIITPVICLQGNVEKQERPIKCATISKIKRSKQMSNLNQKYHSFNNMFLKLPLDQREQIYLNIIHKDEEGTTYIGECNYAEMKHGRGVLIDYFYQTYYVGHFKYDKEEGYGTIYRLKDDLIIYQGNFHLGKPLGQGIYYYYEPYKYQIDGDFNEVGEGKGQVIYNNSYWNGAFYAWLKNGTGELFSLDGQELGRKNYELDKEVN